jgi:HSP20 family molecular chaperone IbpA
VARRGPLDGLTGLEALAEIGKRLGALPDAVKAAVADARDGRGGEHAREGGFTIDTPAGPLKGVASMSFRTGPLDGAGPRRAGAASAGSAAARAERPRRAAAPDLQGAREPLVDCFDEGGELVVTVELPGVRPDEVDLSVDGEDLRIATTGARKYRAVQPLGHPVVAASLSPELRNGILSIRLRKASA